MCGKSHRADTVVVSALIMLLGRLMDRRGASGEAIFERTHTHTNTKRRGFALQYSDFY